MSEPRKPTFRGRAKDELSAPIPPVEMTGAIVRKLVGDSAAMLARGPADATTRAAAAREYAVDHLEELHEQLKAQMSRNGTVYHRAETGQDAVRIIRELLGDARRVAKSKTMVGEEIGLTAALRDAGLDVLETDIGEYIVDIEGRGPSHITAPALHLNRSRIRELLARTGADLPDDDPTRLSQFVRDVVGSYFSDCDAAITGANTTVAASGRLVAIENEGNVSLGMSHPKKHIVVTGLEKIVARDEDALALLQVLAPSATAQPLTAFSHLVAATAPGQERHVVFVDNGRSKIASDPRYRSVLRCIRCGACMNACPVYRVAGGLSYGSPYMGPIGAILSPLLWPEGKFSDLPKASSLCGRCSEVCPVGIRLDDLLLELRADPASGKSAGVVEQAAWKGWASAYTGSRRARIAGRMGGWAGSAGARLPGNRLPLGALKDSRDPDALSGAAPSAPDAATSSYPEHSVDSDTLVTLYRRRATELGIDVVDASPPSMEGEVHVAASAAIAGTGSILLTGQHIDRRALLNATRIVASVDSTTVVRHPIDLAPFMDGHADALVLTGASRTADIEKQIVRGIHGPEDLMVVLPGAGAS